MNVFDLQAMLRLDSSDYDTKLALAETSAGRMGGKVSSGFAKIGSAAKVAVAATGLMVAGTTAATASLVKQTSAVAEYGDHIDKMSQKLGISSTAYQEWDAILQHSGASIDSLKAPMKTLATQAQKNASEFQQLGISQQEVATLSQEDLFAKVITGLQGMEQSTEKTALASKLLGKGAVEMGALLNTSAEDTEAMRQAVHDLGGVMSEEAVKNAAAYQDQLQDLQTGFAGLKRSMLGEFMPSLTTVMKGLTDLFAGVSSGETDAALETISEGIDKFISKASDILPKAMEVGGQILGALAKAIVKNVPKLASAGTRMMIGFVQSLISAVPTIASTAIEVIMSFVDGISNALPQLMPAAAEAIVALAEGLISSFPRMVEAAGRLILGLAEGFMNALPTLIQAIPSLIGGLVGAIIQSIPTILSTGVQLILTLGKGIISAIPSIIAMVPQLISGFVNSFTEFDWSGLGAKAIELIGSGIDFMFVTIPEKLSEIGSTIIEVFSSIDWMAVGATIINFIVTGITSFGSFIGTALQAIGSSALSLFKSINWSGVGSSVISFIVNGISGLGSLVGSVLSSIATTGASLFRSIPWSSVGSAVINFITSGIRGLGSLVSTALRTIGTSAMNAFKSISWGSVGRAVVQGIARGITGGASLIVNAAKNAAKAAFDKAKAFLGISSPSKLFRDEVGKRISEGIGVGIMNAVPIKETQWAMSKLLSAASEALDEDYGEDDLFDEYQIIGEINKEDSEGGNGYGGEITINVYPSAGMDERALAERVSDRLDDMYRRRRLTYA